MAKKVSLGPDKHDLITDLVTGVAEQTPIAAPAANHQAVVDFIFLQQVDASPTLTTITIAAGGVTKWTVRLLGTDGDSRMLNCDGWNLGDANSLTLTSSGDTTWTYTIKRRIERMNQG